MKWFIFLSILLSFVSKDLTGLTEAQKEVAKYLGSLNGCRVINNNGKLSIEFYNSDKTEKPDVIDNDIEKMMKLKDVLISLDLSSKLISVKGLQKLNIFNNLEYLQISNTSFDDSCRHIFKDYERLKDLTLINTKITSETIIEISKIKILTRLDLTGSTINDDGIEYLGNLEKLNNLILSDTKISNETLKKLSEQKLNNLCYLWLQNTNIDDKGAQYLLKIPSLSNIYLAGTKVSKQMIEQLKKKLYNKNKIDFDIRNEPFND